MYFNGKLAEEIGFDKIRRQLAALQDLRIVILDGMCVTGLRSGLDDGIRESLETGIEEIFQTCPSIRQLDLSRNLLEHWVDVAAICKPLSALSSLDLRYVHLLPAGLSLTRAVEIVFMTCRPIGTVMNHLPKLLTCPWTPLFYHGLNFSVF